MKTKVYTNAILQARIIDEILLQRDHIVADNGGVELLSSTAVARSLRELGFSKPGIERGSAREKAKMFTKTVGRAIGAKGLDLPAINKGQRTRYAIAVAGADTATQDEMRNRLDSISEEKFEELEVG